MCEKSKPEENDRVEIKTEGNNVSPGTERYSTYPSYLPQQPYGQPLPFNPPIYPPDNGYYSHTRTLSQPPLPGGLPQPMVYSLPGTSVPSGLPQPPFAVVPPLQPPSQPQLQPQLQPPTGMAARRAENSFQAFDYNAGMVIEKPDKKRNKKANTPSRRRALTACNNCRLKKVRCDNIRPRCTSCVKNDIDVCEYSNEDQLKDMIFDPASNTILEKLDNILSDLNDIKGEPQRQYHLQPSTKVKTPASINPVTIDTAWDMSFLSILRWNYFMKQVPSMNKNYNSMEKELMKLYIAEDSTCYLTSTFDNKYIMLKQLEKVLGFSLSQSVNSFFVNCHTKTPVLDSLEFLECIELCKLFYKIHPNFSLFQLAQDAHSAEANGTDVSLIYQDSIASMEMPDYSFKLKTFNSLVQHLPLIPIICALGVIASSVQLDNFAKYSNSMQEREDTSSCCLTPESVENIPDNFSYTRIAVANAFVLLSKVITDFFPGVFKEMLKISVLYHLFTSQLHLYTMKPTSAYRSIVTASQTMMYFLQQRRNADGTITYEEGEDKGYIDRLFWVCLKLECELRVELSPNIPGSGIVDFEPPCNFPIVADPVIDDNDKWKEHSPSCVQFAAKFDDQYTWYYFLTEIAVRKVDNVLFNDFFSIGALTNKSWDDPSFYEEHYWFSFVRYINQYNGIINSLSPRIRNFVLKEVDITQIFKSVATAYEKRKAATDVAALKSISEHLDDFLIDDDLLIQAQSESIMYIKTRILTSKMLIFRPMVYLFLEDKISLLEILEAAFAEFSPTTAHPPDNSNSSGTSLEIHSSSLDNDVQVNYDKILEAPLHYQRSNHDEDFSEFVPDIATSENYQIKKEHLPEIKKKIMKLFFINLKTIPKLNIPKLGAHRHPGQWYYLRNLLIGNFLLFLLHKKLYELLNLSQADENIRALVESMASMSSWQIAGDLSDLIEQILPKEVLISSLKHSLIVYEYWKDESKDCTVYAGLVQKCLDSL